MDTVLKIILGFIFLWIIIGFVLSMDKVSAKLNIPKYSRISDDATTVILILLVVPMSYGLGDLAEYLFRSWR